MTQFKESPSQTAGPYVHIGCTPTSCGLEKRGFGEEFGTSMFNESYKGDRILLDVQIFDGAGDPVKDGLVEIWQSGPNGQFHGTKGFENWGRQATHYETGRVGFETLKPGKQFHQSPHILVWIAARGINLGLMTRIYFEDEDNSYDPVFQLSGSRASTLVAKKTETGYTHEIYLQGDKETVFFDV